MNGNQTHSLADQLDFQISLLRLVTTAHLDGDGGAQWQERDLENLQSVETQRREG